MGEGEQGSLGGEIGGFEVVGDLIESLPDPGVVAAHVGGWRAGSSAGLFIGHRVVCGVPRSL